jgi:hypothetical protein
VVFITRVGKIKERKRSFKMDSKAEFKEIGRIKTSDATEVVLSKVIKEGREVGMTLSPYISSVRYTGFGKGVSISRDMYQEFAELIAKAK